MTLTLALGTERMAKRMGVVRRLAAVETLGSVTVIATDKTGTLTENTMTVRTLETPDEPRALLAMILASDAEPNGSSSDPLEEALCNFVAGRGVDPVAATSRYKRASVRPFDSSWKYMRVTVLDDGTAESYLKGAPEVLLACSKLTAGEQSMWVERVDEAATDGYRVLALAWTRGEAETDLEWLGIVSLWDPPRAEVAGAISAAQQAGIRVLMITGDHPATANAIARSVGIATDTVITGDQVDGMTDEELASCVREAAVFARVSPEHKLALVKALKTNGETVAMTGDGINDAPALKHADIGVAMGQRGSDVTREVADLVLLDDNFATIAAAMDEGRSIYTNILRFIRFLFSTNVALVFLIAVGVLGVAALNLRDDAGNLFVPLLAVQLLWINIIADGPPALALGMDRNPGMMAQDPRPPGARLLTRAGVRFILTTGTLKAGVGILLFFSLPAVAYSGSTTQTAVFLYESLAQLAFVYPARRISNRSLPNPTLNLIIVASVVLQIATITVPGLRTMLGLVPLDPPVLTPVALALAVTVTGEEVRSRRAIRIRRSTNKHPHVDPIDPENVPNDADSRSSEAH